MTIMKLEPNQIQVTTIHPQAIAIIKQVHKSSSLSMTFSDHLSWKIIMKIQKNKKIINLITSSNQLHGHQDIRSTYHITLQATPYQLVFDRDMIHNIPFRAKWDQIQKRKQDIINKFNQKENQQ
jgi:LmbE family N-acetylglucosaminyl deacetylase